MAANFIPLVLLGGGAAYVATQKRKKKKEDHCPAEVKTTIGEAQSAAKRATAKHGEAASPFKEAEFFVNAIMPKGCGPGSYKTRINAAIDLPNRDEPIVVDLSASDVYMLAVGQAIGRRVNAGKLKEHQAEKFWADALTWYKRTTGKEFDPNVIGQDVMDSLDDFMAELAEGLKEAMGMGGVGKRPKKPGGSLPDPAVEGCPPEYIFEVTPDVIKSMQRTGDIAAAKTPDPYRVADAVFASIVPRGCTKESKDTVIEIKDMTGGEATSGMPDIMALPTFYAALALGSLETVAQAGHFPTEDPQMLFDMAKLFHSDVNDWHMGVMGRPLPESLQFEQVDW